jgi:hypothetical protein
MYHPITIQKLSHAQISKLLRGGPVRIKHGQGHTIHVSHEQHKRIMSAHRRGCGINLMFDPYQQEMHRGNGIFDSLKHVASKVAEQALPVAVNLAGKYAEKRLLGEGLGRRRGRGFLSDLGKSVAKSAVPVATNLAGKYVESRLLGGSGFLSDLGKSVAKQAIPVATNLAVKYVEKRLLGGGVHRRHKKKHPHKHEHHGESLTGGALFPAGYGVKKHKKKGKGILDKVLNTAGHLAPLVPLML